MRFKIVGIGEPIWDRLPGADQLGGAPTNFSYHAHALGAQVQLISRVGSDSLGNQALTHLSQLGLDTRCVQIDPHLPTSTATIDLLQDGTPHFTIHEDVAWDNLADESNGRLALSHAHAICFGTLAQRNPTSRTSIKSLLPSAPIQALRILVGKSGIQGIEAVFFWQETLFPKI